MGNIDYANNTPKCRARNKVTGEKCRANAVSGLVVCRAHGGGTPNATKKAERARAVTAMTKFVKPLDVNDPEANPITAFETEFRRTLGRIRWFDEQLAALDSEKDLIWGKSKVEVIGASDFNGTNTTYEARSHVLYELQFKERGHLLQMEKIWLSARFDQAKLDIQRAYVVQLDAALTDILTSLGHSAKDPEVRQVVRDRLLALPMRAE